MEETYKMKDIRVGYPDCCFSVRDNWFRYRTGAIIIEDDEFLVVKSATSPNYYTVGGGVHMNETAEQCVLREVREETGVEYEIDRLAVICENFFVEKALGYDELKCHVIEFYFLMKSRGKKEAHCDTYGWDGAKEEICWIKLDDLSKTDVRPEFLRYRMKEILESKGVLHIVNDSRQISTKTSDEADSPSKNILGAEKTDTHGGSDDKPTFASEKSKIPLNLDDKIALVYEKNLGYYKFPTSEINGDKDNVTSLVRLVQAENNGDFELKTVSIKEAVQANVLFDSDDKELLAMVARETLVMTKMCGLPELMPRAYARLLLEHGVAKNPGQWREHSYAVAEAAEKVALAVNKNKGEEYMNPNLAYTVGLLHDIGRQEGVTNTAHVYDGYHFLKDLGYDFAAKICLTHSFNRKTMDDYIGKIDITDEQVEEIKTLLAATEYDDYDRLIQMLDSTCMADGTKNMEQRMNDIKKRYGSYPQGKWNKNFELKDYFEALAGKDLYEII